MSEYRFAAAAPDEEIVYGACRPAHPAHAPAGSSVENWIAFMQKQDIKRVCCLLDDVHLGEYDDLLGQYREAFGDATVCHAPICDFEPVAHATLHETIFPFLEAADTKGESVVVHCSAGSGRTGHILALWLADARMYSLEEAIDVVRNTGRRPLEGATLAQLRDRLQCDTDTE